ncbi:hypothetical protein PLUTE_a5013 [Pseudoalteromonas luteoviolacea DSM 6061]|nr:hypothetical protein [Pseudoalteromonas luteoviolacea DSM 6061]
MLRVILLLFIFLCGSSFASKQVAPKPNFEKLMQGVWAESYNEDGKILSYMAYLPEGRFHAFGYLENDIRSYWFADGVWKMVGEKSCIIFTFDSFGITNKDELDCVTVISVNDTTLVYRDDKNNSINTLKRVSTGFIE